MSDLHDKPARDLTQDEIVRWVRSVCSMVNVETIRWPDGSVGLVNAPRKWCAVVDAMFQGLVAMTAGEPLPRLVPTEKTNALASRTEGTK